MSFEFLAPDAASRFAGGRPPKRSPIEWQHRGAGARITERAGWNVVSGYGDAGKEVAARRDSVGVADLSHLGKVELQASPETVRSLVARLAGGAALELGRAEIHEGTWWCPVTAERVLAITEPEATTSVCERLEAAAATAPHATVTELTSALASNLVAGPLAREAFARTTALDMRPDRFAEGAFAPVSVARTPGMVLHQGRDSFLHLFGAGYAAYTWTVFEDAAKSLGGRAVGADALPTAAGSEVGARA